VFLVLAVQRSLDGLRVDEEEEQPGGDGEHLVGRERSGSNVNAGKRTSTGEGVAGERMGYCTHVLVPRYLKTMNIEMIPEASRTVLIERHVFDIVVIPVLGYQLTPPEGVDDVLRLGRAEELDGELVDGHFESRSWSGDVPVGFYVTVTGRHDARLFLEGQGVDLNIREIVR
jgi:hypothetical protein